jgi:glycosyltransferase involved in cell wall biosynthesis
MIIAIDGYEANSRTRVGVGRFAYELISHLATLIGTSGDISVRCYVPQKPEPDMPSENESWTYRVKGPKRLWTMIGLPLALAMDTPPADVVFSPTHYIPRFTPIPKVMAIMDVSYLSYPDLFRKSDLYKLTRWTAYAASRAAAIITISEFSKHAIMKAYSVPSERVHVVYPALPDMKTKAAKKAIASDVSETYILAVGTLQPRKNYERLIEAFSRLSDKTVSLVIVGKKGWLFDGILEAPRKFGVEHRVKFMDFVADDALPDLYRNALLYVSPSLYEGFGLPVLEAMSYGCPVVVSSVSSLPEIAGDAGIYVDPNDTDSIVRGMELTLGERGSAAGKKRIALGIKRAGEFSWEKAAKQVLTILTAVGRKAVA